MTNPSISLVAFEARVGGFIFVRVPNERGRYVRTDVCVATVGCPECDAIPGEPCKRGKDKYGGGTHFRRRDAHNAKHGRNLASHRHDVVEKPHFVYAGTRSRAERAT